MSDLFSDIGKFISLVIKMHSQQKSCMIAPLHYFQSQYSWSFLKIFSKFQIFSSIVHFCLVFCSQMLKKTLRLLGILLVLWYAEYFWIFSAVLSIFCSLFSTMPGHARGLSEQRALLDGMHSFNVKACTILNKRAVSNESASDFGARGTKRKRELINHLLIYCKHHGSLNISIFRWLLVFAALFLLEWRVIINYDKIKMLLFKLWGCLYVNPFFFFHLKFFIFDVPYTIFLIVGRKNFIFIWFFVCQSERSRNVAPAFHEFSYSFCSHFHTVTRYTL